MPINANSEHSLSLWNMLEMAFEPGAIRGYSGVFLGKQTHGPGQPLEATGSQRNERYPNMDISTPEKHRNTLVQAQHDPEIPTLRLSCASRSQLWWAHSSTVRGPVGRQPSELRL